MGRADIAIEFNMTATPDILSHHRDKIQRCSPNARQVVLVANPKSGASDRRHLVEHLAEMLTDRGFTADIETDIERVGPRVADALQAGRLRTVVAAGGDGTVSLLANRLPAQTPISVLPLGTANLVAKYLGIRPEPEQVADMIRAGHYIAFDAGLANGKLFLAVCSCGFDAEVVRRLHGHRAGHISYASYMPPLVTTICKYRYPRLRVRLDDQPMGTDSRWAFVMNMPRYAMGLQFTPQADPTDGWLDVCLFSRRGFWNGLNYFFNVLSRRHQKLRSTAIRRFRRLEIESDEAVPYEVDGDPGGMLPLTIEVVPQRLRLLVPHRKNDREP